MKCHICVSIWNTYLMGVYQNIAIVTPTWSSFHMLIILFPARNCHVSLYVFPPSTHRTVFPWQRPWAGASEPLWPAYQQPHPRPLRPAPCPSPPFTVATESALLTPSFLIHPTPLHAKNTQWEWSNAQWQWQRNQTSFKYLDSGSTPPPTGSRIYCFCSSEQSWTMLRGKRMIWWHPLCLHLFEACFCMCLKGSASNYQGLYCTTATNCHYIL